MSVVPCKNLDDVRRRIDALDERIVDLLCQRLEYIRMAATFKKDAHDVKAPARVKEVIGRVRTLAQDHGADPKVMETIYRAIIETLIKVEMKAAPPGLG